MSLRLALAVLVAVFVGLTPAPAIREAAGAGAVTLSPSSGPPGAMVSISAVFPAPNGPFGSAQVLFDNMPVATEALFQCTTVDYPTAGFGTQCTGHPVYITIPVDASPGPHLVTVSAMQQQATATFTVTPPTPTPNPTATNTPTPIPTNSPIPLPTSTPTPAPAVPTATPALASLPQEPLCPAPGTTSRDDGRIQGGQTVHLQATGLPANTPLVLVYSGPRWQIQGHIARELPFSILIGLRPTGSDGTFTDTATIPMDAMMGTAHIYAFDRDAPRSPAVKDWTFSTAPHDAEVVFSGPPGTPFVVSPQLDKTGAPGSCSGVIPPGGTIQVIVPAGIDYTSVIDNAGSLQGSAVIALPGSIAHVNLGETRSLPPLPPDCSSNLHFLAVFDDMSGNELTYSGFGPLGYFLTGVPITDTALLTLGTKDGSPVSDDCKKNITASLKGSDGHVTSLGIISPAAKSDVDAFMASLFPQAKALDEAYGTDNFIDRLFGHLGETFVSSSINYLIPFDPSVLPPGDGQLILRRFGVPVVSPTIENIDPYWADNNEMNLSGTPSFDPGSRTYQASGVLPKESVNYSFPQDFGWDKHGFVKAYKLHIDNILEAGVQVDETFNTAGTWHSTPAAVAKAELVNQTFVDDTYPLTPEYNDPDAPGIGMTRELGDGLHWHPDDPVLSFEVFGLTIPVVNKGIGFGVDVKLGADGDAYLGGEVNPDFSLKGVTLTGKGSLEATVTGGMDIGIAGAGAGIDAEVGLTVPVVYTPGSGVSASACFSGHVDFAVTWWYDIWVHSDSGTIWSKRLVTFSVPSGCGSALRTVRAQRVHDALVQRGILRDLIIHIHSPAAVPPSQTKPAVSIDARGHGAAVWVERTATGDRLMASSGGAGHWSAPATITAARGSIVSPHVAELGDGRAVATWASTVLNAKDVATIDRLQKAGKGLQSLSLLLRHQEIMSSIYARGHWSRPARLTHDSQMDGGLALAADPSHHSALLVWTRGNGPRAEHLVATRLSGSHWSRPATIPGTQGLQPHDAALAFGSGRYSLAWASGNSITGALHLSVYKGHWTRMSTPAVPAGVQALDIAARTGGLALTGTAPAPGDVGRQVVWAATSSSGSWKVQTIAREGATPHLAAGRHDTILTYSAPAGADSQSPYREIETSVAPSGGVFSAPWLLVAGPTVNEDPAVAVDNSADALALLYLHHAASGNGAADPIWRLAVNPEPTELDAASGLESASVPLGAHIVADLAGATLSDPYPTPGAQISLSLPLYNTGYTVGAPSGTVAVRAGGADVAQVPLGGSIPAGGSRTAPVSFAAPPAAITLRATGVTATDTAELALPDGPSKIGAGRGPDGVRLTWTAPAKATNVTYRIYRSDNNGAPVIIGLSQAPVFIDPTPPAGVTMRYQVTAVDRYGRESAFGALVDVRA